MRRLTLIASVLVALAFVGCDAAPSDPVVSRDLYERGVLVDDAAACGLFAGVPSDDEGPWTLRHLDNPQPPVDPETVVVRIEFAKTMSPGKAALVRDALKALGAVEIEGETDAQHGTTTAGTSTSADSEGGTTGTTGSTG